MPDTTFAQEESTEKTAPADRQRVWLSWVLVAVNLLVYAAMAVSIGNPLTFPAPDLLAWGGNFAPHVAAGELWRPFTAMFLHAGIIHLGMNMWVLSTIGPFIERLFGVTSFLLIYLLAGISGSIFGMLWHADVVGVGASGAIFGLYGALLGFLFIRRHVIPAEVLRPLMQNGLYFLGINLVLGFSIPGVDVAAHVLGAVAGFVGGMAATWPQLRGPRSAWLVRNALLAGLGIVVCAALPLCIPASAKAQARFFTAADGLNAQADVLLRRYNDLINDGAAATEHEALADRLEQEVRRPWSEMYHSFPPLAELPGRQQANPKIVAIYEYMAMMEESFEMLVQARRQEDDALQRQADAKMQAANEVGASIRQ